MRCHAIAERCITFKYPFRSKTHVTSTTPILKAEHLSKKFGHRIVLNDLSFDIYAGEIFGVIGASGSGKTTMLSTLIGFLTPEVGDILFRSEHLLEHKGAHRFSSVFHKGMEFKRIYGFAAQTPSFYGNLTVKENLLYFGSLYDLSADALRTNTNTLLHFMELEESQDVLSSNLSGGMQRRLDIACALIHDPKILILDEPTADLDPVLRIQIWKLIKQINKKGTTIILASHHLTEIETLCNRIAILKGGKVLAMGTPAEIKEHFAKHEEIHIESFPGHYDDLITFKDKEVTESIIKIENTGTKLVIYTTAPAKVLMELLKKLEQNKENLIDLHVAKPTLDDIFIMISKDTDKETKEKKAKA